MNYLEALKKSSSKDVESDGKKYNKVVEDTISDEMNYELNIKDSFRINVVENVKNLCEEFVEKCLEMDYPLLMKHHTGKRNFILEFLNYFEDILTITMVEYDDTTDNESETDSLDYYIDDLKNGKY